MTNSSFSQFPSEGSVPNAEHSRHGALHANGATPLQSGLSAAVSASSLPRTRPSGRVSPITKSDFERFLAQARGESKGRRS